MTRVLVIDDSAVMRTFLSKVVESQPGLQLAGVVSDPVLAMDRIRRAAPDVITLDVEMPGMNGLDFLRTLMAVRPLPVVMISSQTREGADVTLRALELGAVDFFPKPASLQGLDASMAEIADKIRNAAQARVGRRGPAPAMPPRKSEGERLPAPRMVIGIGASTGGVEALRTILTELPAQMPPILIAQHMLAGFTETFARRLNALCALTVKEAQDGEEALAGHVYVAPGGRHLVVDRVAGRLQLGLRDEAPVNRHRPSVDVLFRSLASTAGADAVALMLTGMGADGAQSMLALRQAGARTLAQDEATSVVFGMPRQAIALGGVQEVLPLEHIASRLRLLGSMPTGRIAPAT
jgi:two-component system chemotaxis response regulator CheB